jgi:hypothetical protein
MIKATCPTDPTHNEFITTAHIMQDWRVDEHGNFIDIHTDCLEVSHEPDIGNVWTCSVCYVDAVVENVCNT